jgi:hypothetical protein
MKMKIGMLLLYALLLSCSESNDEFNGKSFVPEYNLFVNGELTTVNHSNNPISLVKVGHLFKTDVFNVGGAADYLAFFEDGRFIEYRIRVDEFGFSKVFQNFLFNTLENFELNIESIDATDKTVKGMFTGYAYVYTNPNTFANVYAPISLHAEKKHIWCSFKVKYKEVPVISDPFHHVSINNVQWKSTFQRVVRSNYFGKLYYDFFDHSNNYNVQIFADNYFAQTIQNFTFNSLDNINKVSIRKFNFTSNQLENYMGTGTLTIQPNSDPYIKGMYTFTGVNEQNPSDIITITDGTFSFLR